MKVLIICSSIHHFNTKKVADRIGRILHAELIEPQNISDVTALNNYDLIGFGSGVYFGQPHREMLNLIERLPHLENKQAFIFSTSGSSNALINRFKKAMVPRLESRGLRVIGEFACKGYDTFGPFKLIGGLNRGRPNEEDLEKAEEFARKLIGKYQATNN